MLPIGQKVRNDFPRFGLPEYADRFPTDIMTRSIVIELNENGISTIDLAATDLPRHNMQSDFHCVTTWSYAGAQWDGYRFIDFFERYVKPLEEAENKLVGAVFYAQDGYKTSLLLEDLLVDGTMLADTLNDEPLPIEHGAPLRLIMPVHYGYKNPKHLSRIEFFSTMPILKRGLKAFLDHPRARVQYEERGRWIPGWILRYPYRALIGGTVKDFRQALEKYRANTN